MIRRDHGNQWLLIRQTEHARLSADMCRAWAAEAEPPPASVVLACARHDDGWLDWERSPKVCARTGRPLHFPETDLDDDLEIWRRGPVLVAADDPYAGLLVSGHGSALMESKVLRESTNAEKRGRMERYLEEQQRFRERVAAEACLSEALGSPVFAEHLTLLQLVDYISLVACCRPIRAEETLRVGGEDHQRHITLRGLTGPGKAAGAQGMSLQQTVQLEPWPFRTDAQVFRAEATAISKAPWSEGGLAAHLAAAEPLQLEFRCIPG